MADHSNEQTAAANSGIEGGATIPPPPPTDETIITSLPEKLPESVRGLLVDSQPLPPGVAFFEERITAATLVKRIALGSGLLAVGALGLLFGLKMLVSPRQNATVYSSNDGTGWVIAVSAVFCFAGWMMVSSVPACLRLGRQQNEGRQTRYGVFLTAESMVWRSYFDTTVIPRMKFHSLQGSNLRYMTKNGLKSFELPAEWVGAAPSDVFGAIAAWNQLGMPPGPPPPIPVA